MAHLVWTMDALDANDPSGVQRRTVGLEQVQMDAMMQSVDRRRLARLAIVKEVLDEPTRVYEDLKRPNTEKFHCYVGHPDRDMKSPQIQTPPPKDMLFLVFVAPSGKLTDWRWERVSDDDPDMPEGHEDRFGKPIWPATT